MTCPDCAKTIKVKDDAAGKKVRCPACSTVISIPTAAEDEFDDDIEPLSASRKKRRIVDDEDFDDGDLPISTRGKGSTKRKRPVRGKSNGPNWLLIGAIAGGGLAFLMLVLVGAVVAVSMATHQAGQRGIPAIHPMAPQVAWMTFRHPLGYAQVDMPGMPTLNVGQSKNGTQTYSLFHSDFQMSLTALPMNGSLPSGISANPALVDLMFGEMERTTPQQMPGARLIASRRITAGTIPGLELKIDAQGNINLMRFYLLSNAMIGAEFITRNESAHAADRERFFSSFRGPDGQPFGVANGATNPAGGSVPVVPFSPGLTVPVNSGSAGPGKTLGEARRALKTKLIRNEKSGTPVPPPPPGVAQLVRYDSPSGKLSAYLTTIPSDGKRRPAIVWVSGGDCNTIDGGFFQDSPPNNDQTASAFRKAGIITMYPSLRGGNDNPGFKEAFLGEIDDVLAAADFLSRQDGVDPQRIYLGGHSTGGTVALLAAETSNRFRAIFSFGPVEDIRGYGPEFQVFDSHNPAEVDSRNPGKWLDSIQSRTFVIEGSRRPGNIAAIRSMSRSTKNPHVTFLAVASANHFNILAPATRLIAERILQDSGPMTNINLSEGDLNLSYAR